MMVNMKWPHSPNSAKADVNIGKVDMGVGRDQA